MQPNPHVNFGLHEFIEIPPKDPSAFSLSRFNEIEMLNSTKITPTKQQQCNFTVVHPVMRKKDQSGSTESTHSVEPMAGNYGAYEAVKLTSVSPVHEVGNSRTVCNLITNQQANVDDPTLDIPKNTTACFI